jgi:DNA-binding Lrp family transcriptional regulator
MQLIVRNKVKHFSTWYEYFKADSTVAAEYGVTLASLWKTAEDPNDVFFLLDVEDVDRANAFMARPESHELGVKSGVIDGEFHYLEAVQTER